MCVLYLMLNRINYGLMLVIPAAQHIIIITTQTLTIMIGCQSLSDYGCIFAMLLG